MKIFRTLLLSCFIFLASCFFVTKAWAFCGFYVAKADSKLYNQASQVAIARNGNQTVLTMANDYQGEVKDFAIVVPVPVVLKEDQVEVSDSQVIERLDAFSAPRLVEYFDPDPCAQLWRSEDFLAAPQAASAERAAPRQSNSALGVTVESQFSVGEYDIVILSARESGGLETWLTQNGYRIPQGARQLLQPYIRQRLKFFVAKVNLEEYETSGYQSLRPIKITYESPRFMLPIRLGMVNAQAAQDLIVYILSPQGQAEVTNYRTVKVPSDAEIPLYVKDEFSDFYKAMFDTAYNREGKNVAFVEYAWDMAGCDPCSAEPLSADELHKAGAFWVTPETPQNVFITRMHVRYTRDRFPEDLVFQQTNNRASFQGRYVLRHAFTGEPTCAAGEAYQRSLPRVFEQQAQTLARLTGWSIQDIREKLPQVQSRFMPWWQRVFQALWHQS
ncbi:MAG: DUF2330 domain-containing protein [Oscillatoriophycideae cyanobacterium NC_groundwater_1537_Pr4_S-0.65um_50_18]|nr:DUF2330 domain-containing protein [Oscillatoriophycideae cyanobacterium NC_groundwater_1537_Pr4_S-0.65um_50_18]